MLCTFGAALNVTTNETGFLSERLTQVSDEEAAQVLSIGFDTQPCLFKLGSAFYDFTPFKLALNLWPTLPYTDVATASGYQYNFTWCQLIEDTTNVTSGQPLVCTGSYFAG